MNNNKFGHYSIIIGGITFFFVIIYTLDEHRRLIPEILIGMMSILVMLLGMISIIKREHCTMKAVIGIILGALCLYPTALYLLFPEKTVPFNPQYTRVSFLGNGNIIGLQYCNSYDNCFLKYTYDISTQKFSKPQGNKTDMLSLSRNGKKVVFADGSEYEKNIFIMNVDGSDKKQLTHSSDKDTTIVKKELEKVKMNVKTNACPSFSPDGKKVIFVQYKVIDKDRTGYSFTCNGDIYEVDCETGSKRRLTNYHFNDVKPKYFSDGNRILFILGRQIEILDVNNSKVIPLDTHSLVSYDPSISFDDKIVYTAETDNKPPQKLDVFIIIKDKIKRLTNMSADIGAPEISSDGNWIIFPEFRLNEQCNYREAHFWIIRSDGTGLKELLPPKD